MKRTFSREYGFLLGCWAVFAALSFVLGYIAPGLTGVYVYVIDAGTAACQALSAAALGILAIRYGLKPYLVAYLAVLVWYLGTGVPQAFQPANSAPAWAIIGAEVLDLVLTGAITFVLAKVFYRLLGGKEWAVALLLVVFFFLVGFLSGLVSGGFDLLVATLLREAETAVLSGAAYALLYFCVWRWWETKEEAAEELLEEEKAENEEEMYEEYQQAHSEENNRS